MIQFTYVRQFSVFGLAATLAVGMLALAGTAHAQGSYTILHNFSGGAADGARPGAGLIQGSDGRLYGTTNRGGSGSFGTVFAVAPDGSGFTILHNFTGGVADGAQPLAGLIQGPDGTLYGTTNGGGSGSFGTVFAVAPDGSSFTILHSFVEGSADGLDPTAGLIQAPDGTLYGTTPVGGSSGSGTVFAVAPDGSGFTILHSFTSEADGYDPEAGLIQGPDGTLYGTTAHGGVCANCGTIFALAPDGSVFRILHSFHGGGTEGGNSYAGLIQGANSMLYGTTSSGSLCPWGTIFALAPDGSGFTTLHCFSDGNQDGANPVAGLIQGPDGTLYGTARYGGSSVSGTVFAVAPDGSVFTVLHNFTGGVADGANPYTSLIQGTDGALYGTTDRGGIADLGVVFRLSPGA